MPATTSAQDTPERLQDADQATETTITTPDETAAQVADDAHLILATILDTQD